VPLVHHYQLEVVKEGRGVIVGQEERQAFRRGDERGRETAALPVTDPGWRIAGAGLDGPGKTEILDRGEESSFGVGGECA
jgi:hypothetical protein